MLGWHHRLNGHEFEQALGIGDGQGGMACCGSRGCRESGSNERLSNGWPTVETEGQKKGLGAGWV